MGDGFVPNDWRKCSLAIINRGRSRTIRRSEDATEQGYEQNREKKNCPSLHHQLTPHPEVDDEVLEAFVYSRRRKGRM